MWYYHNSGKAIPKKPDAKCNKKSLVTLASGCHSVVPASGVAMFDLILSTIYTVSAFSALYATFSIGMY